MCWFTLWIWIVLIHHVLLKDSRPKKSGSHSRHNATKSTKGDLKLKNLSKIFSFKSPLVDFVALCLLISRHNATKSTKGDLKLKIFDKFFSFKSPLVDFVALCLLWEPLFLGRLSLSRTWWIKTIQIQRVNQHKTLLFYYFALIFANKCDTLLDCFTWFERFLIII